MLSMRKSGPGGIQFEYDPTNSAGRYIDSTIETIDDLGLSIISMVF